MTDLTDKELQNISNLADKILEVVMNTEIESADAALAALLNVATTLALTLQMSEQEFAICSLGFFRAGKQSSQEHEVH
jgi:hypothetical protein